MKTLKQKRKQEGNNKGNTLLFDFLRDTVALCEENTECEQLDWPED